MKYLENELFAEDDNYTKGNFELVIRASRALHFDGKKLLFGVVMNRLNQLAN